MILKSVMVGLLTALLVYLRTRRSRPGPAVFDHRTRKASILTGSVEGP